MPLAKIDQTSAWNLSTQYSNSDSSWLFLFKTDTLKYTVTYRQLDFIFGSQNQVAFISTNPQIVYDATTNTRVRDNIRVPTVNVGVSRDVNANVYKNYVTSDGYSDTSRVYITYPISATSQLPTDPSIFSESTANTPILVFYEKYSDADNLIRYRLLSTGTVVAVYNTYSDANYVRNSYPTGTVFYTLTDQIFYQSQSVDGVVTLVNVNTSYLAYSGRQDLVFEYQHLSLIHI